jgi:hypothetical protein
MIILAASLTDEEKALLITLHKLRDKGHKIMRNRCLVERKERRMVY